MYLKASDDVCLKKSADSLCKLYIRNWETPIVIFSNRLILLLSETHSKLQVIHEYFEKGLYVADFVVINSSSSLGFSTGVIIFASLKCLLSFLCVRDVPKFIFNATEKRFPPSPFKYCIIVYAAPTTEF